MLAFEATEEQESDCCRVFAAPLKIVTDALTRATDVEGLAVSLPDLQRIAP